MLPWLRLYHELIDDPKIRKLSPELRWNYVEILCISNRQNVRGTLPSLEDCAIHMRLSRAKAQRVIDKLKEAGFIDEDENTKGLKVHGWEERQFKSDDTTERTRLHRERCRMAERERSRERSTERDSNGVDTDTDRDKKCATTAPAGGQAHAYAREADSDPPYPDPDNSSLMIHTGAHPVSESDARDIWRTLWRTWGNAVLCYQFYEHQRWFAPDTWRAAIRECVLRGKAPGSIRYLERIAGDVEVNGVRSEQPPAAKAREPTPRRQTYAERMAEQSRAILEADYSFLPEG